MPIRAIAINCSLKSDPEEVSSTDKMIGLIGDELSRDQVELTDILRLAAANILPGVTSDEGPGHDWPDIRQRILGA